MLKVVKFEAKFEADVLQTSYLTATGAPRAMHSLAELFVYALSGARE